MCARIPAGPPSCVERRTVHLGQEPSKSTKVRADSLEFGPTMCDSHHPTYALHTRQLAANARVLVAHGHVVSTSFEGAGLFSVGV